MKDTEQTAEYFMQAVSKSTTSPQLNFEEALFPVSSREGGMQYPSHHRRVDETKEAQQAKERQMTHFVPLCSVRLVRTDTLAAKNYGKITSPQLVYNLVGPLLRDADREHFLCILLSTKHDALGVVPISIGDLSSTLVHPREVFKAAILANAADIILCHNHPSGDSTPSIEDIEVSHRLSQGGEILGINVIDHVIIDNGRFTSLKEHGVL
jgi:DNA repair protein RadC